MIKNSFYDIYAFIIHSSSFPNHYFDITHVHVHSESTESHGKIR